MLFSVCIPVYNTSKYLDECLQSVLQQTETDYEIVLVDDGSTDDSGQICDRYAAQYPHIRVIHKENEGLMITRRRGFQEAKGDYFLCLDSDDAWNDHDALKKLRAMIENLSPDLVVYEYIYGAETNAQPDRTITLFEHPNGYVFQGDGKKELYNKLLLGQFFNPIFIKAFSRNILDLGTDYSQWKESLVNSQGEDLFQSLPLLDAAQRVAYLKEPLYFYRWNPKSISRNIRSEYYYAYRTVYQRTDLYLEKWGFSAEEIHRIMQLRLNMLFGVLLSNNHSDKKAEGRILHEVAEDPFFRTLWAERDPKYICKYYMLAGKLLVAKRFVFLRILRKIVKQFVAIKRTIKNRRS